MDSGKDSGVPIDLTDHCCCLSQVIRLISSSFSLVSYCPAAAATVKVKATAASDICCKDGMNHKVSGLDQENDIIMYFLNACLFELQYLKKKNQ